MPRFLVIDIGSRVVSAAVMEIGFRKLESRPDGMWTHLPFERSQDVSHGKHSRP